MDILISALSNLNQTLHSLAVQFGKIEKKQVAKTWSLELNKQKFGTTMCFPESLEYTLFNLKS